MFIILAKVRLKKAQLNFKINFERFSKSNLTFIKDLFSKINPIQYKSFVMGP